MSGKKPVLILCNGNSARSQMAEGLLRRDAGEYFDVESAGNRSKHVDEFEGQQFDYVIIVCDNARESCPVFFRTAKKLHHNFEDPAALQGSKEQRLALFRRVRDELRAYLGQFAERAQGQEVNE